MLKRTGFKQKPRKPLKRTPLRKVSPNKVKYSNKRMIYGQRVWSLKVADTKFSNWLRERVGRCELCGKTEGLTVSHYIGRKEKSTRYLVDNCDIFCWSCHAKWENRKQYEYREWKIKKIGEKRHQELKDLQKGSLGEKDAIYNCMLLLANKNEI